MRNRSSIALGFLGLILVGAVLLASPWARTAGRWGDGVTALFTACSAVCVTGLSVVEIAAEYSRGGQIVLLSLVEIGCLGLMTCGTFFLIAVGRRLSLSHEFSLMNAYGVAEVQGLRSLILWVVGSMLAIETAGAAAIWYSTRDVYISVFYSVMSFCNAGFGVLPDSLAAFADRPFVIVVSALETILGGIGFLVIFNLCTFKFLRRRSGGVGRLSLHTRVVLRFTVYLLVAAFVAFLALEWDAALAGRSTGDKLLTGFYQAVTPRTCGFTLVPTESLRPLTRLLYEFLMFIGGAPGSAAAGLKITTFAVLIYTITALCRGDSETIISKRLVPTDIVRESLVIFVALSAFVLIITGALFFTEEGRGLTADQLFFEAVSSVTTTGLSMGDTTSRLSLAGRFVIMVGMFIGRLGALTVVMIIGDREISRHVRFPSEELVVG